MITEVLSRNPRLLFLLILVITVAGAVSLVQSPRQEDPTLSRRVGLLSTVYPGADALKVESLVTIELEEALQSVPEIKELQSNSQTGSSNLVITLKDAVADVEPVWTTVRELLAEAAARLPEEALDPELEVFPMKAYAVIVALQLREPTEQPLGRLRAIARRLAQDLRRLPGTEAVDLFGDPGEEIAVEIDAATLSGLRTSTGEVAKQIRRQLTDRPLGALRNAETSLPIKPSRAIRGEEALANMELRLAGSSRTVRLDDIASIQRRDAQPIRELALIEGRRAITLGVMTSERQRFDRWHAAFEASVASFRQSCGSEVVVKTVASQSETIERRFAQLGRNLLYSAACVLLIVFVVMGTRSMVVVGVVLPLVSLAVLAGLYVLDVPLHQMSITGLIVALGLLIDNAIVVVEDIRGRVARGECPEVAIVRGVRHLSMPLIASTLTTALALLPIALLPGPPGEFVGAIAVSVILALGASLVLSLTVIPALQSRIGVGSSAGFRSAWLAAGYRTSLRIVYRFPLLGVVVGIALPLLGYGLASGLPEQFFPSADRNQLYVELSLPAGTSLEKTAEQALAVRESLASEPAVSESHWFVGRSAPTFYYNVVPRRRGAPHYAQGLLEIRGDVDAAALARTLQAELSRDHAGCRVLVRQLQQGPPLEAPISISVVGPEIPLLQRIGSELRKTLSQTPGVVASRSDLAEAVVDLEMTFRAPALREVGLGEEEISGWLYQTLEGAEAGTLFDGAERLPVTVVTADLADSGAARLAGMVVPTRPRPAPGDSHPPSDQLVPRPPLEALVELKTGSEVAAITRVGGDRINRVMAYLEADLLPSMVLDDFQRRLTESEVVLPPGYRLDFVGEDRERRQAVRNLMAKALVLFSVMLLALVLTFGSFRHAAIIVSVGVLSAGLGPFALWLFGYPLGFMAILGTMGLVGVAINDSIVVLAALREAEAQDESSDPVKIVEGCTRHIVATTLTTIFGFTPLILGGGGFWPPLAICIAGGVGGATLLALYFVPSVYLLLKRQRTS